MKTAIILIVALLFVGCDKEEEPAPKPDPIIGTWIVDKYVITDLPADFSAFDGIETTGLFGENSYVLKIYSDKTFERELRGDQDEIEDDGTWDHIDGKLELEVDGGDDETFDVISISEDELSMSMELTLNLLPDAVLDTLQNTTPLSVVAPYFQEVQSTVIFEFEK